MERVRREAASAFAVAGAILTVIFVLDLSALVNGICLILVALGACLAALLAPRLHRPDNCVTWYCLSAACVLFAGGAVLRGVVPADAGDASLLPDVFTLCGYPLIFVGFGLVLKARGGIERYAVMDAVTVCLAAGLVIVVTLTLPTLAVGGRSSVVSIVSAVYPLLDVIVLLVLLNLLFTTEGRIIAGSGLTACLVFLLIGDLGYAWIGIDGQTRAGHLFDVPYLASYVCAGYASLHPSMATLTSLPTRKLQAWSLSRLCVLVPALMTPGLFTLIHPPRGNGQNALFAAASIACSLVLVARAVSAVQGHVTAQRDLRFAATHDTLTGLANRRALDAALTARLAARRPGSAPLWLLHAELDNLKLLNDSWGPETGDRLLTTIAQRLVDVAGTEALVARVGAGAFAVVIDDDEAGLGAVELAGRLRDAIAQPVKVSGLVLVVTASVGIASARLRGASKTLLRDAETAGYRAASGGCGWSLFDRSMRQEVRDRFEVESALRTALQAGELWVAYQPIIDLATEGAAGAEALVRWTHPERGDIPPGRFIPVAEEAGLIEEIGAWVLIEAVRQVGLWGRAQVLPDGFSVSVNVSARQLSQPGFSAFVTDTLAEHEVDTRRLTVELTESVVIERSEVTAANLRHLRDAGIKMSVDDFGTGYASMSYLTRFPLTGLKIDKSMVDDIAVDDDAAVVASAIAALAAALRLTVVAEGVETTEQRDVLRRAGVPLGQGWLWGRAVEPVTFLAEHLRNQPVMPAQRQAVAGVSKAQ